VTRVSTSFAVEADTYVSPFKAVSTRPPAESCAPLAPGIICCVCLMTKVNLNVSSSSLLSLRMKFGYVEEDEGSGSWQLIEHSYNRMRHVVCRRGTSLIIPGQIPPRCYLPDLGLQTLSWRGTHLERHSGQFDVENW
jgi:hypothetical protein